MKSNDKIFDSTRLTINQSRRRGFSLMELTIVVAIISIMTVVGLVSMNASKNKKDLETEARKVAASLRQAQNYALTGKIGENGPPCLFRWKNSIPSSNINYFIEAWAGTNGVCTAANGDELRYSLQGGVTFKNSTSDMVDFLVPFGAFTNAYNTSSPDADKYKVTVKKGSYCIDISVSDVGMATEGQAYSSGC